MKYILKKAINLNGVETVLSPLDIDYVHRSISLTGEIDEEMATIVNAALRCLARDSSDDITLYIQSPGGSVSAGLSIFDTANALNCEIITVACGRTASMGAFLLTCVGTNGKRWCQPNAEVLLHQPVGGIFGQASDIRIHAEQILNTRAKINLMLSKCTGKSIQQIENDTDRDYIMSADEALNYGLVDKIGDPISER